MTRLPKRWRARLIGCVVGAVLRLIAGSRPAAADFQWNLPVGFPTPKTPDDNAMSVEKVALGRFLFYDTRLSGNETYSCSSCHQQELAFTDGLKQAVGSTGQLHPRSSMSIANAGYASVLGWANPLLTALEKQALVPMFGDTPVELGLKDKEDELVARLKMDTRYQRMFAEAFPGPDDPVTVGNIVRAIACFVRTLISGNSPYDRYIQGLDDNALSLSAQRGGRLFFSERLECFHCHGGFNLSVSTAFVGKEFDEVQFDNNGLYNIDGMGGFPPDNTGLYAISHDPNDMGRFKAPTLRNIELTAPYMHDGSIATLDGVLDHYAAGGRTITDGPYAGDGSKSPLKSGFVRGFTLTDMEREDVLNFLKSFTDMDFVTNPHFSSPFGAFCAGDCDLNKTVTVDELIATVNVALGGATLASCVVADPNGDGIVTVDEVLQTVSAALNGCAQQ